MARRKETKTDHLPDSIEIAIIDVHTTYNDYDDQRLITSITEWQRVTKEEYGFLAQWLHAVPHPDYHVTRVLIRRQQEKEVATTVRQCIEIAEKMEREAQAREAERKKKAAEKAAKAEEKRLKKLAETEETRRKLFQELAAEFGGTIPVVEGTLKSPKSGKRK